MELLHVIQSRYSCRNFSSKPVPDALIHEVLQIAGNAPSAANKQAYRVIILNSPENLDKCHKIYSRDWIKSAPAILLIGAFLPEGWVRYDGKNHAEIDATILTDHITLLATSKGLATCWICHFNKQKCIELFDLPNSFEPLAILPIGYPEEVDVPAKKRRSLNEWIFSDTINI